MRNATYIPRTLALVLLTTAGAACGSPMAPVDGGEEPPPAQVTPLRRNATVIIRRIDVIQACDGRDILGDPRKGNFAYRIQVQENLVGRTGKTQRWQSSKYGSSLGQIYLRGPGKSIDLNDRRRTFYGLADGESLTMSLASIEWDAVVKDKKMNGSSTTTRVRYPGKDGRKYYELDLKRSSSCHVELEYAIEWTTP